MVRPIPRLEVAFGVPSNFNPDLPDVAAVGAMVSGTGAITVTLPTGWEVNDVLVLFLETEAQAITVSGWTAAGNSPQNTTGTRLSVFWKRAVEGETDPVTSDSGDHQVGYIIAVRGCIATENPWDVTAGGVDSTSDTSGSIPGATTTGPNRLVLVACSTNRDADGTAEFSGWTNANLEGLEEEKDATSSQGAGGGIGVASGRKVTAGAYGSTSVTLANASTKGMWSGALKPGWVDISDYLWDFEGGPSGRQRDIDEIEAGEMTFNLDNDDRRFDPTNVSGPYYPWVEPMAHVRLLEEDTEQPIFRGFVDGWPQSWSHHGLLSYVEMKASDGFKPLADANMSGTVWEREVKESASVRAWYRFNDVEGTLLPADSGPNKLTGAHVHGSPAFGQPGLLQDDTSGVTFAEGDWINIPNLELTVGGAWSIEFLIQRPTDEEVPSAAFGEWIFFAGTSTVLVPHVWIAFPNTGTGRIQFAHVPAGGLGEIILQMTTGTLWDGKKHHVMCKQAVSGATKTLTLSIDGVVVDSDTWVTGQNTQVLPAAYVGGGVVGAESNFQGTLQEFLVYNDDAESASVHSGWALSPFSGVLVSDAIDQALDEADWPADDALRNIFVAASTLQDHALGGGKVLPYIQALARTEGGVFGIEPNGAAVFFARDLFTSDSPSLILTDSDTPGVSEIPYDSITFAHDDTNLVNEARVGRDGGTVYTIEDAASKQKYLTHTWEATDLLHDNDDETQDHGAWVVHRKKVFRTEVRSVTVLLHDDRVVVDDILGVLNSSMPGLALVQVDRNPMTGAPISELYHIERVVHNGVVATKEWSVTLELSMVDPDIDIPWLIGDADYGILGTTTRLGF